MAWDVTVELADRPGTLADLGEAAGAAGINLEGICGFAVGDIGIVHVLVEDGAAAATAFEAAGLTVTGTRQVLVKEVENELGVMGAVMRGFANAGINVDLVYLAADTRLVIGPDDLEAGRALG